MTFKNYNNKDMIIFSIYNLFIIYCLKIKFNPTIKNKYINF